MKTRAPKPDPMIEVRFAIGEHHILVSGIANLPVPNWAEGQSRGAAFDLLLDGCPYQEFLRDPPRPDAWGELIANSLVMPTSVGKRILGLIDQVVSSGMAKVHQLGFLESAKDRIETAIANPLPVAEEATEALPS